MDPKYERGGRYSIGMCAGFIWATLLGSYFLWGLHWAQIIPLIIAVFLTYMIVSDSKV